MNPRTWKLLAPAIVAAIVSASGVAWAVTVSVEASKDSFLRSSPHNTNEGANAMLVVSGQGSGRSVLGFDLSAVSLPAVQKATLVLTIRKNFDNWGSQGRTIDAAPLLADFAEGDGRLLGVHGGATRGTGAGVTWQCATDSNIANHRADCASQWDGGSFGPATNQATITNHQTGEIAFDVTADVVAGVTGWIVKRSNEAGAGRVDFYSREGAAAQGNSDLAPRLAIVEAQTVSVSGRVYDDLNGDGSDDGATDPGLASWTVNLLDAGNQLVASTTSDSNGNYAFPSVAPGSYTVTEVLQSGWIQTQPVNPNSYSFNTSNGNVVGKDFGNFQTVSVSGNVYNDLNGNGQQDAGEPGLANWTVDVLDSNSNVVASAVSDTNGDYTVTGVGPGSFTLAEAVQSGWLVTQPTNPTFYSFTTSSGVNVVGGIFGNFQTVSVSGNVYNDLNGNHQQDGGEPGLQGFTVNVVAAGNVVVASAVSDANGNYTITDVGPGSFTLVEVVPAGWVITQPFNPDFYSFTSSSGVNVVGGIFGNNLQT